MTHPRLDSPAADRNLLFGILALQMDFINRDALIAAMNAWVLVKDKPLGQILIEQQALAPKRLALLEALVQEHLDVHGQNPEESLAALDPAGVARLQLDRIADPDVKASLARMFAGPGSPTGPSAEATVVFQPAKSTGARFVILRPHARGGLGEVFVALDEELNREVALKAMSASCAQDGVSRARFVQEAEITGRLEHPGIVPVYGYGLHQDGRPYYAMRFIKGETFKQAIQRFHGTKPIENGPRALALRKLLGAFLTVCQAIHYAHSRGILHRDLKPDNIMLGKFGETLVVDWGLAKPMGQRDGPADLTERSLGEAPLLPLSGSGPVQTQAGSTMGTPAYMSPEQAAGRQDLMGPASDIYGLGATLYCLLTGNAPFAGGELQEVLKRVQKGDFPRPRALDLRIPAPLEAICLKAMAPAPPHRYGSAQELAEDLEHWLADEPIKAYPEPRRARLARWGRRHKPLVAGAAALLLTAVVALSLSLVLLGRANTAIQGQRDLAETNFAEARRQREQADAHLYRSLVGEAGAIREARSAGYRAQAWKRLEQAFQLETPEKDLDELRQEAVASLGDFVGLEPSVWKNPADADFAAFDLSPDGALLAIVLQSRTGSQVLIRNIVNGQEVTRLKPEPVAFLCVKFALDGKRLFAGDSLGTIWVWETNGAGEWVGAKALTAMPQPRGIVIPSLVFPFFTPVWGLPRIFELTVSPDGTRLAACFRNAPPFAAPSISVWNLADGSPALPFSTAGVPGAGVSRLWSFAFSRRGDLVAAGFGDDDSGGVVVWDADTRMVKQTLGSELGEVVHVGFSADGKYLACACWHGVAVYETVTFRRRLFVRGDYATMVAFSPDNSLLAIPGWKDGVLALWDINANRSAVVLHDPGLRRSYVGFSADGRRLVSAGRVMPSGDTVRIWNLGGAAEKLTLAGHSGGVPGLAFSPDGTLLASTGKDHTVRLWDPLTAKLVRELRGFSGPAQSVAFSPDGRFLATTEYNGGVKIWDVRAGEQVSTVPHVLDPADYGAAFSPDGRRFMVCGYLGVKTWNIVEAARIDDGRAQLVLKESQQQPMPSHANSACFSPDSKLLAWVALGRIPHSTKVSIWDLSTGQERSWPAPVFPFLALSFLPDSRHLALVHWQEGKIELWDAASGQRDASFGKTDLLRGESIHTALSADGAWLAVGGSNAVTVWNINKHELVLALPQELGTAWSLAWSPNKELLAVGYSHGGLVVWNLPKIKTELSRIGLGW